MYNGSRFSQILVRLGRAFVLRCFSQSCQIKNVKLHVLGLCYYYIQKCSWTVLKHANFSYDNVFWQ